MPTALVTGVTGQDGSYLAEKLLARGWTVDGLVRGDVSGEQPLVEGVRPHMGDLAEPATVCAIIEETSPDVVFNLAGVSSVAQSWAEPVVTGNLTGLAVGAMLETCWSLSEAGSKQIRFIQASSAELFGNATQDPQTEDTPIRPTSPYGAAKAYAHHMVDVYRQRGLWASSAILYNHESPRRPPAFVTRKITMGVAAIAAGMADTIELGNLDAQRDWGWAPDYMDALISMASSSDPRNYIVATGETHSVRDFVTAAFNRIGITDLSPHVRINERWNRPVDAPALRGDSSRLRRDLGWSPSMDFQAIVAAMVDNDLAEVNASR